MTAAQTKTNPLARSAEEHGKGHEFKRLVKQLELEQIEGKQPITSMEHIYQQAYRKVMRT